MIEYECRTETCSYTRRDSMILEFLGPPSVIEHGLCGFNRGRSLVVKSRVKSLATPAMSELDREKVISEN